MGQPLGGHGIGTGHRVIAACRHPGQQVDEQLVGQPAAVGQNVHPAALGQSGAVQAQGALVGDRPQEALFHPAGQLPLPAGNLPGKNPLSPLSQLIGQRVGEQSGTLVLHDLRRCSQASVGTLVTALVARHTVHDLPAQRPQRLLVVTVSHVYIALHRPGILGLHHMGRRDLRTRDKLLESA